MADVKKIDLKRFKKTLYGLIEFATIVEQAGPKQRKKIIDQVRKIDPEFLEEAMRKVVFFDELVFLDEGVLSEILSKTSPRVLAYAIKKLAPELKKQFLQHLSYVGMKQTLDEEEQIVRATDEFIHGAQKQILKIGRELEAQNRFVFELSECPRFNQKKKSA
jgi:flagellar motor switch protein FliG